MKKIDLDRFMIWVCLILLLGMMIWVVVKTVHKMEQGARERPSK